MRRVSAFVVLLLLTAVSYGQSTECEESELGYACRKQMTDYFALHWSLGPTTSGAEAEEGEIAIALVGNTTGWVGFAFAEEPGEMAPADFVIGWVDGEDVVVTPYRSEIQSITEDDVDEDLELKNVEGSEEGSFTIIQFVRSLTAGTTEILLDEEIPVNVATGTGDELAYHGPETRFPGTVMLSLAMEDGAIAVGDGPPASAPAEEMAADTLDDEPAPTPEAMEDDETDLDMEIENGLEGCAPSSLGYSCMAEQGDVVVHWTLGPADAEGEVPEIAEGEVAMAVSAETEGWVGVSFAESAGSMFPADAVIGWVTGSRAVVRAYRITGRSVSEDDVTNGIGLRATGGSEDSSGTTIRFVLDGTFTFPVDFTDVIDMNWATGITDSLSYHAASRGSFEIQL